MQYNANDFSGSDVDRINAAIRAAAANGGIAVIPSRISSTDPERRHWLIDSAILLPSGAEVILKDCRIKLSDQCRDNFFRSASFTPGGSDICPLSSIHVRGEGEVVLEGADHPRATGDSGKTLGLDTYGTDMDAKGECPRGDWRNIGVLLVKVHDFSLTGLQIVDSHSWAISLEHCDSGLLRDITFHSRGHMTVDGKEERSRNQDGIDLRRGCHDIRIETIRGETGDDLVALTALRGRMHPAGAYGYGEITSPSENPHDDDIHSISIRDIEGYSALDGQIVRFLNADGIRLHDVTLAGLQDSSPRDWHCYAAVRIGDRNPAYGEPPSLDDTYGLTIRSVDSNAKHGVLLTGFLSDSSISGVINRNPLAAPFLQIPEDGHLRNVVVANLETRPS